MNELEPAGISASSDEIDLRSISASARRARPWPLIAGCVALCLLLAAFAEYLIRDRRRQAIASQGRELEAVATLKASLLERWLAERSADVAVSARGVAATMQPLWGKAPSIPAVRGLVARAEVLRSAYGYDSVQITDLEGKIVLAAPPPADGDRLPFSLPPPSEVRSPQFNWLPEGDARVGWSFALAQPLAASEEEAPMGWLVLTMNPSHFVEPLLADWPGGDQTAETFLMRRDFAGGWYYRSRPKTAREPVPLHTEMAGDSLAQEVLRGANGALEVRDARGADVLAFVTPIAGVPWVLGTKIDRAELLSHLAGRERFVRGSLLLAVALSLALGGLAQRANRRRFESRATRANQRFRALFAAADEGVLLLDASARTLDANPAARELLAIAEPFRAGTPFADFIEPGELAAQPLKLRELTERGTVRTERRMLRGGTETFAATVHSIRLPDGRILTFFRDLSDLRRAEERERRAKRMASFGTWDWDPRTDAVHWDDETFLVLGFDPAKDLPSTSAWRERIHAGDRERVREDARLALKGEAALDHEYRLVLPDGQERHVRTLGDVVRAADGTVVRVEGAIQDVTARRLADAKLSAAQQQLAESQKAESVGRLAGSIAHDFNNIVGVIGGFSELAELELGDAHPTRPHLVEIRQAAARAAELTRQLLAFARRKPPELQVVSFAEVVAEVEGPLRRVLGDGVELDLGGNCEGASVRADPAQIVQLILNLAMNARDAMPGGGRFSLRWRRVELSPALVDQRPPLRTGRCLELVAEDTGAGMDAATLARCFEPFFTTKGQGVGTGLGLSSVKSALDSCGAAVEVESEVGRGSRFTLWFPVASEERRTPERGEATSLLGRDEHVLVVDDVAPMREMVGNILSRAGFRVTLSADARSALERLGSAEATFDLLLTDVVMPEVSGRELARRAHHARPGLRVLFMTGHSGLQPDGMPFELPESLLIEKPFTGSELVRRIRASLDAPPEALFEDN